MRFLVVDDSHEDVALLRCALQGVDQVEITPIDSGKSALQFLVNRQPWSFDLVVVDWRMPGIAGDELATAFLNNRRMYPQIPVVILSCAIPPPTSQELNDRGAVVIEKPTDLDGYDRLAANLCSLAKRSVSTVPVFSTS
jgi:CheY-like chemotaxis protein